MGRWQVVGSLLIDRKNTLVITDNGKNSEELYITTALTTPNRIFDKVKQDQLNTELKTRKTKKKTTSDQGHGAYVEGLPEATERMFRKYGINTAIKPYKTLRNLLFHPKDTRKVGQTGECVCKIPCHNCNSNTLDRQAKVMEKDQKSTEKKWQQNTDMGRLERFGSRSRPS